MSPNTGPWVVLLRAHAAARFKDDDQIRIEASAASTAPVHLVTLRNDFVGPPANGMSHRGIRIDVSGRPESLAEAAGILGGIGGAYANVLAVAANAFVGEPRLSVVYRLPTATTHGQFFQRTQVNEPASPPAVVRTLSLPATGQFIGLLDNHVEKDRLFRSCAHYAEALRHWHEFEALQAAESLFIAAETLGPIILRRLLAEKAITKDALAERMGFPPDPTGGTKHLYQLDAHILRTDVFGGDAETFKRLKDISHGFEHGFGDFGKIRTQAELVRDDAAKNIRAAILRETGVDNEGLATLTSKPFDEVQGGWDPYIEIEGTLTPRGDSLPTDFIGLRSTAHVASIIEKLDDHREVSVTLSGDGSTIPADMIVTPNKTQVWMPGTKYTKLDHATSLFDAQKQDEGS